MKREDGLDMQIQLLRHATLMVSINGKTLLVDPMLSDAEVMAPIINSPNERRNPLVAITAPPDFLVKMDAVVLTHTHRDHFDDAAAQRLPKEKPVFCQPADEVKLQGLGFVQVYPVVDTTQWEGITIMRTGGEHGTGEIGQQMAPVSGYVLQAQGEPALYIAGDTVYCTVVEDVLRVQQPAIVVVNAGGARFRVGEPITMTAADVAEVCRQVPKAKIVAVHMEAINHCLLSRAELRAYVAEQGLTRQVVIPADGESVALTLV
jgi:L-ascorbate metabolism protein UlaG (beta-lactamase superfamily)